MAETEITAQGEDELTEAVIEALTAWMDEAVVTAAVQWPGQNAWARLVEQVVEPVSERLYRAAAAVTTGEALDAFLTGVRERLVDQSTLINDIKEAQRQHGDDVVNIDWTGASDEALPWRSRSALIGQHEAQVTSMQAAVDSTEGEAQKRWRHVGDARVRPTHRTAGGQTVPLNQPFRVGTASLMYPGDPRGPANEVLRCRCAMFLITPDTNATLTTGEAMNASLVTAAVTVDMDAPLAPRETSWDGDDASQKLRAWATNDDGELDEDRMARGFLWRTDGPPSDWKLGVATIRDGRLELVWRGIAAAAAAVQGARAPLDLPESDIDTIKTALNRLYAKAAETFADDTIIPPWERENEASMTTEESKASMLASVTRLAATGSSNAYQALEEARHIIMEAAVHERGGAWRPEASWFQPPTAEAKAAIAAGEQPLISDNGRVLGYVAPWHQPDGTPTMHLGYLSEGEYLPVPNGQNYGYFHQRNINYPLSDGTAGHVGIITDAGHPTDIDNPRHQAALVRVGEDDMGVWIAGAVFPDVVDDQMRFSRMKASAISGEWNISDGTFMGAAMVNHPGFPQPLASGQDFYALAASRNTATATAKFSADVQGMITAAQQMVDAGTKLMQDIKSASDVTMEVTSPAADPAPTEEDADAAAPVTAAAEKEASIRFLQGMNQHHQMGIQMVRQYLDLPDDERDPDVSTIAGRIFEEQTAQIEEMERILRESDAPIDPPDDDGMRMNMQSDADTPPLPDNVEPQFAEVAQQILANKTKITAATKAYTVAPGIDLPAKLHALAAWLEDQGATSPQARAASVKAAEIICRSEDIQNAAVRAKACLMLAEYKAKAGMK